MNVTDHAWQVLQYHPPFGIRKFSSERLEVMSATACYINHQHSITIFCGASQHIALYGKPLNPARSAASVACHVSIEVLQRIASEGRPVFKRWEIGGEGVLKGSRSNAGG